MTTRENEITFIYTVGGYDVHYENMKKSISSVKSKSSDYNFLVLEFGNKLSSNEEYEVINLPDAIDFNSGKKVGYLIWKHKYIGAQHIKTKYGVYVDSDTAMANNNITQACDKVGDGFGVTRHFWVPNIEIYEQRACTPQTIQEFHQAKTMLGLENLDNFYAGGVFIFCNNEKNQLVMTKVLEYYEEYYGSKDYVRSITDELFLAAALKNCSADVVIFNGALNHCSMGDENMPLMLHDDMLYGRNPFESNWCAVTFLHCDVSRRDPSEEYKGRTKELIRNYFGMIEL
jgi:hypothetical protein